MAPTSDNSTSGISWGGEGINILGARDKFDGSANTTAIVARLGSGFTYAARTCSTYSAKGGYTSGWFLPSGGDNNSQIECLNTNSSSIGGFTTPSLNYWTSTQSSADRAWYIYLLFQQQNRADKHDTALGFRCVSALIS